MLFIKICWQMGSGVGSRNKIHYITYVKTIFKKFLVIVICGHPYWLFVSVLDWTECRSTRTAINLIITLLSPLPSLPSLCAGQLFVQTVIGNTSSIQR